MIVESIIPSSSLRWSILCLWLSLLIHHALAQNISPSNFSTVYDGEDLLQLFLRSAQTRMIAAIEPLTSDVGLNQSSSFFKNINISGPLVLTDSTRATTLISTDIAYISCEKSTAGEETSESTVLRTAASQKPVAIVLYSIYSHQCTYIRTDNDFTYVNIFTMTSKSASLNLQIALMSALPLLTQAQIMQDNSTSVNSTNGANPGSGNSGSSNVLGTSPTTAVAMIILYSITGVITALFLIIIITGAVRAHRHPERYGPRSAANGRPRQSRAKGIARAMLETLPIVKFGEKEEPKPARDVELGATTDGQRNENGESSSAEAQPTTSQNTGNDVEERRNSNENPEVRVTPAVDVDEVTPVVDTSDRSDGEKHRKSEEGSKEGKLGCSICTEDFVKGEDVRVLPCDHKYHPECIDPWLLNVSGTCPLCRIDLRPAPTNSSGDSRDNQSTPNTNRWSRGSFAPPLTPQGTDGEHRPRMSRFLEFHLGLTPYSAPEERIAALLRLRDMNRDQGSSENRRRSRSNVDSPRPISQRLSGLGLIRDSFRRRSARIDGSDAGGVGGGAADNEPPDTITISEQRESVGGDIPDGGEHNTTATT